MNKTKKLSRKHFRYLTKKEIKNPLYAVAYFCTNVTELNGWRRDIDQLIRISATNSNGLKPRDFGNLHFCWHQLYRHVELIYVLKHAVHQWETEQESAYYDLTHYPRTSVIFDAMLYGGTYLEFNRLSKKEFGDIGFFIGRFFAFQSLKAWQELMDKLLATLFYERKLSEDFRYTHQYSKIYRYLEKLTEAIFLIYVTKAKAHVLEHHTAEFFPQECIKDFAQKDYLEKGQTIDDNA